MAEEKKAYTDSRWHDLPVGSVVGHVPVTEEQKKRDERFKANFKKWKEQQKPSKQQGEEQS